MARDELKITCSDKGILLKQGDIKVLFDQAAFPKLKFVLKCMKPTSAGKIFRVDENSICKFTHSHVKLSTRTNYIIIKYTQIGFVCQSITEKIVKCVTVPNVDLERYEKILIQNFQTLFGSVDESHQKNILKGIQFGNEKVTFDIAVVVMKSSRIPTKNPYVCQFIHAFLTHNLNVYELLSTCLKIVNRWSIGSIYFEVQCIQKYMT